MTRKKRAPKSIRQARRSQKKILSDAVRKAIASHVILGDSSHSSVARAAAKSLGMVCGNGLNNARSFLCFLFENNLVDEAVVKINAK